MPVHLCDNGKYRIGSGPCIYGTKDAADRAYQAYLAETHKAGCCSLFTTTATEQPAGGALINADGRITFGGVDVGAVASSAPGDLVAGPVVMLTAKGGRIEATAYDGDLDGLREAARGRAARTGEPVALAKTVKSGTVGDDQISVLAVRYLYRPHNRETLLDEAHKAYPEALRLLAEYSPVRKELDPLDPRYFDQVAAMLSRYMARDFSKVSKPAFDTWINNLVNRHWAEATDAELMLLTKQFNKSFREISGKHWVNVRGQIYHRTEGLGQAVKRATVKRYDVAISPNLALKDATAIRQMTASHSHYVTDAMGNMATASSQQARQIVRNGLAKGLGSKEIGAELHTALAASLKGRTRAYFDMAAISMLNRAQTYSKLVTYSEAGVESTIWDSVLDEITTPACRFCDGKIFSVSLMLGAFSKTASLSNPQEVRFTQPWMRQRRIKSGEFKGKLGLFLRQRDGTDRMVAAELISGIGKMNDRGKWHPMMDIETLQDMGFSCPGHGGCRSTLAPNIIPPKTRTRRVNVPAPRPKIPLVDPMGMKAAVATVNAASTLAYYEGLRLEHEEAAVEAGRKPPAKSKYDKVVNWSERQKVPAVFSQPNPDSLALEDPAELAAQRARAIMLATIPKALAQLREIRLDSKIKPADALAKVDYNEKTRVLKISKTAAKDPSDAGRYTTGKQLAYALELERRRQMHKDKTITPADREAARKTDLITGAGTLFDPKLLEDVP